jgi:hypothetical protein
MKIRLKNKEGFRYKIYHINNKRNISKDKNIEIINSKQNLEEISTFNFLMERKRREGVGVGVGER